MKFPKKWRHLLDEYSKTIEHTNVQVFDPSTINKLIAISLITKLPTAVSQQIHHTLQQQIPKQFQPKILFQPPEGFHFTIQWTSNEDLFKIDTAQFEYQIVDLFMKYFPIIGDLYYPFFGPAGLGGILKTKTDVEFKNLRTEVLPIWNSFGLTQGYSANLALAYVSFSRYIDTFTKEESQLLMNLPTQIIKNVSLDNLLLVLNNKFVTSDVSVVLSEFKVQDFR